MPLSFGNRIKVNASGTPGTSDFVLGTPASGYQSFASAIPGITTGYTVRYVIEDGANWEIGTGTYNTTGPKIVRTTVIQSSAGGTTLVNFTSSAVIMLTVAANDYVVNPASSFSGSITETVFTLTDGATVNVDPANGTIQTLTLGGTGRTLTFTNMLAGQAVTLMINDGTAGTITTWNATFVNNGGLAPTLSTTAFTVVTLWKVGSVVYAAIVGA